MLLPVFVVFWFLDVIRPAMVTCSLSLRTRPVPMSSPKVFRNEVLSVLAVLMAFL